MQFEFVPGRGTTESVIVVRPLQEKYLGKDKAIFFFVNLEMAFEKVP